jgi:hypothetical protein
MSRRFNPITGKIEEFNPEAETRFIVGPTGPVGPAGPAGRSLAGPIGPRGPKGDFVKGDNGERGPVGPIGPQGPAGKDGLMGIQGPRGFPGDQGAKGLDGKDGRDGKNGKDGRDSGTVHYVEKVGYPDKSIGNDGDWVFNSAKEIFFKKTGKWDFYYSIPSHAQGTSGISSISGQQHDLLAGLTDDDHTIYALLAGRTGGQTLTGGIAASNNLVLRSTSHGTKGQVYFDETTASTSAATGAVRIAGGLGVAGTSFFGAQTIFDGGLKLNDSDNITFGDGNDVTINWNGTLLDLTAAANSDFMLTNLRFRVDDTDLYHRVGGDPGSGTYGAPSDTADGFVIHKTQSGSTGQRRAMSGYMTINPSGNASGNHTAINARTILQSGNYNLTGALGMSGGRYGCNILSAVTGGTISNMVGVESQNISASAANITNSINFFSNSFLMSGSGTITNNYGFYSDVPTVLSGAITNHFGFLAKYGSGATNQYAFATEFNGGIYFGTDWSFNDYINSILGGDTIDYHTLTNHNFYVGSGGGSLELTINANNMTFNAGASDPVLDWSVSGELALTTGKFRTAGEIEIDGALNHDGTTVGFYTVAPTTRPTAYTQTYATATRTHSALTSSTLTDSTTGTANTTVQDVTAAHDQTILNNNFADLTAQVNALRADLENAKQVLNQVIDDHQLNGLLQ